MENKKTYRFYSGTIQWTHEGREDFPTADALRAMLKDRGYTWVPDPGVHECLRKSHFVGKGWEMAINAVGDRSKLEFTLNIAPAYATMTFFQNFICDHLYGGKYDNDSVFKVYLLKMRFLFIRREISRLLENRGYSRSYAHCDFPDGMTVLEKLKFDRERSWHKASYAAPGLSNSIGGDGEPLHDGDMRYYRDYKTGHWLRASVWYNLNSMWKGVTGCYPYAAQENSCSYYTSMFGPRRLKKHWQATVQRKIQEAVKAEDFHKAAVLKYHRDKLRAKEASFLATARRVA